MNTIIVQAGDATSVLLPADGLLGCTARAVAREYPTGPVLQEWRTSDGTAVIDADGLHLVTDRAETWGWTLGELDVQVTHPGGAQTVAGPYRMRLRPLISRVDA